MPDLRSLFFTQMTDFSPEFHRIVCQFLRDEIVPSRSIIEDCSWQESLLSEEIVIENWKTLLSTNILCNLAQVYLPDIASKIRSFENHPWNQSSQYSRSLISLNHALAQMPIPEVGPHLLESGAALVDLQEYSPWLAMPYTPQHLEFGIFLCLLGLITKRQDLKEVVLRLVHWQQNTLDVDAQPLSGLFVREKDGKHLQQLCITYLLFQGAALLSTETPFAAIAENLLKKINEYTEKSDENIHPLWVLIEKYFSQYAVISKSPLDLSEHIYDTSTALIGYRTNAQHVICTLHGNHTGLGSIRQGDVEIVTYGPQYLPLGNCQGFGIEGNALSEQGMRRSMIEWKRHSFSLKGCSRLVDEPPSSSFERARFRGIWLEIIQEFKYPFFDLKTNFLGLDGWDGVAFSFFVKAARCKLDSGVFLPRRLERYDGEVQKIILEGQTSALELHAPSFQGKMQVIPLAGGNAFWGADFLVAYVQHPQQRLFEIRTGFRT